MNKFEESAKCEVQGAKLPMGYFFTMKPAKREACPPEADEDHEEKNRA